MSPLSCPLPNNNHTHIQLAHGGGGTLMDRLIHEVFRTTFDNPLLDQPNDSAVLNLPASKIAFTTDSFVVNPLFFPGGSIGTLAVCGTVNDLAMSGARPHYLSAGFILEEGFPIDELQRIVQVMADVAKQAGVTIVTGDTKVVDRGKADGVFINTAGVGVIEHDLSIAPDSIRDGDAILCSGDLGRHGIAVMAAREGLQFETTLESDCAPLNAIVQALLDAGLTVRCMRDLTRGGLTSALNEIAQASKHTLHLDESAIPVIDAVQGACEMLGFDPLAVANEGRFMLIVPDAEKEKALAVLQQFDDATNAAIIGSVMQHDKPLVTIRSRIGATRILDRLSGEQLPRIC